MGNFFGPQIGSREIIMRVNVQRVEADLKEVVRDLPKPG